MPPIAWAFVTLLLLALLPGLLVVRAPWTVVPSLSLAFWTLSAWWPPLSSISRERFLVAALLAFASLALLRALPKHEVPPPPGWTPPPEPAPPPRPGLPPPRLASLSSLAVLGVTLALLAPAARSWHAPGPGMAFQTTSARLLVWRDGIPLSAEPLLPVAPFGAHAPAIAGLAADLSRLSAIDPGRAVLLVFVSAIALTLIGVFVLESTWLAPSAAAIGGLASSILLSWPPGLALWGFGEPLLCLGFALPACALLLGHASRSSALAAGMLLAAALLAQPLLALLAIAACSAALLGRRPSVAAWRRLAAALVAAALFGGAGLWPALRAVSRRELGTLLASVRCGEAAAFLALLLALGFTGALARRLGLVLRPGAALLLAAGLGAALAWRADVGIGKAQLPAERREALLRLAESTGPFDVVCAPADALDWVPALAGRAVGDPGPWIPHVYREEWAGRRRRPCGPLPVTRFHLAERNPPGSRAY